MIKRQAKEKMNIQLYDSNSKAAAAIL